MYSRTLQSSDPRPSAAIRTALSSNSCNGTRWSAATPSSAKISCCRMRWCNRDPAGAGGAGLGDGSIVGGDGTLGRSEEHTSELQSLRHLVCRLLLEKKKAG